MRRRAIIECRERARISAVRAQTAEVTGAIDVRVRRYTAEEPDQRHLRLLRARASGHAAAAPPSSVAKNFRRPMWLAM